MRYPMQSAFLIAALLFGLSTSHAQTASDRSTGTKQTFVTERSKVKFLVGSFVTTTTILPMPSMPKGATGKGTSIVTWALDSMFLSIEEQGENTLFGTYKGHGMLGFDPEARQFVLSMFNNSGDRPTYHGNFVGDTLVLQTRVPAPRGTFDQKLLWYKDGGDVKLKVLNDLGKGFLPVVEETSTPVPQKGK